MWLTLLQKKHITALTAMCMGMDDILTRFDQWDTNPDLFNCINGTADLLIMTLLPHGPDLLITRIAGGPYINAAKLEA